MVEKVSFKNMSRVLFERIFQGCSLYENNLFSYKFVREQVGEFIFGKREPDWETNVAWFWLNEKSEGFISWGTITLFFDGTFKLGEYMYFRIQVEGETARLLVGDTKVQEIIQLFD